MMVGGFTQYPQMPTTELVSLDDDSLSLDQARRVALELVRVGFSHNGGVRARREESRALPETLISSGMPPYSVTTGFGDSPAHTKAQQRGLMRMLGCGDSYAPIDEALAPVLVRANCPPWGHSAVWHVVIARLPDLLNADIVPTIREQGSVGTSGDLVPLSYMATALLDEAREIER
jgi:histidine ammonia-lyase/phenylalanine ammonia-lyase